MTRTANGAGSATARPAALPVTNLNLQPNEFLTADGSVIIANQAIGAFDASGFASGGIAAAIPKDWKARSLKAWDYYIEEPLVGNCINSWRTFSVGDEIKIISDDKEATEPEAVAYAEALDVFAFLKDMILQLLTKGEAIGYKPPSLGGGDEVTELQCVNPSFCEPTYENGKLSKMTQKTGGAAGKDDNLDVTRLLHLKWNAPSFAPRGNSMVLPAFMSIELLRAYRMAEEAIAKRWATPLRLIKVGGAYGQKLIMPDQGMLEQIRQLINKMDPKSGMVLPFYVEVETHGTKDAVLNVEEKVRETKEDIMVALGLSRALVTGDGPNFATAAISLQKMQIMIREVNHAARKVLKWIFDPWLKAHHTGHTLKFEFNSLDPNNVIDMKKILIELYDRKLISKTTLQAKMDLDPVAEAANRGKDKPDMLDEKIVKPVVDAVLAGLINFAEGRVLLGLEPRAQDNQSSAMQKWFEADRDRPALRPEEDDDGPVAPE